MTKPAKSELLNTPVEHIDIAGIDATAVIDAYRNMSFTARDTARAADLLVDMIQDPECTVMLAIAGSAGAGGCLRLYADMIRYRMVDVVVATGAAIVDMDFFEALGFRHYRGSDAVDDGTLRDLRIDRIYDTFIDEDDLQACDGTIKDIADSLPPGAYSSRAFIREMGRYLEERAMGENSLVAQAARTGVPVFCPAFSDSSAGFGLVAHQHHRKGPGVSIDSVADFRELTAIKMQAGTSGLFMIGGGVPKNFAQDTVVCAEILGHDCPMHEYAVQITVADVRDGACSSSTLSEARSWGKVDTGKDQMVYAEATSVLPLIAAYAHRTASWQNRPRRNWNAIFD